VPSRVTDDDEPSEAASYGLVMPFIVCDDHGGPYAADAFVGGVYYGEIDAVAKLGEVALPRLAQGWYVPVGLVPQLDLLAMHHHLAMTIEPWADHPDAWAHVSFAPIPETS
jgi:hypothetical protein